MAASGKFDMPAGSPDRPSYVQRGSYTAASLDRSGSFREAMENAILSSLPSTSRSSSAIAQADVLNFLQCLKFDPKSIVTLHKFNQQVDYKRLGSLAAGFPLDDSLSISSKGKLRPSPLLEELKRLKAGLRESSIKARERLKIFNEALSVMNKCFPGIPSRKRSRSDVLSADRSSALFPGDRSVLGSGVGKMGTQSHPLATGYELEQQKSDERTKIAIPNKRTRTSMADVKPDLRANMSARPSGNVDREREAIRLSNSGGGQGEERALSIGVDGWEKSKMKKKRSGKKADASPSAMVTKPDDGYRESKQGMQPRFPTDAGSKLNDSHGFRPGIANVAVEVGKADGSQSMNLGTRSSISKVDQDNSSLLHERRDRSAALEKERLNLRGVNKTNVREDFISANPTSFAKMNSTARAPRSGSNVLHKLSSVQRANVANDWELSNCTSKLPGAVCANNRKRTPSMRSSSPPVAQWAQKISRTARRTNLLPTASNNDETCALDTISDIAGSDNGLGLIRRMSSNSPQQIKIKGDHFSSAALSESEESGAAEVKSRERVRKTDELDEKANQNTQKVSTLVLPPRKNKPVNGDDLGEGVHRQGRTGRGSTSTRSLVPMTVEKVGNMGTAKQLRSARLGLDRSESKASRPPTRKLSDRKAYTRQKHTTINAAADFIVGSDDGHEEILAAAAAIINPAHCCSSLFWRQMEPYFSFISDVDIAYLRQQRNIGSTTSTPATVPPDVDNGFGLIVPERDSNGIKEVEFISEYFVPEKTSKEISLCQRLIASLISEEGNEVLCYSGNEDLEFDAFGTEFELDTLESNTSIHQSPRSFQFAESAGFNAYGISVNEKSELENNVLETGIIAIPEKRIASKSEYLQNGGLSDQAMASDLACAEYGSMSLNERVLLEMQSIGIYPEAVSDLTQSGDEEISEDIGKLEDKYREQVERKKTLIGKMLNSALETRERQEKEFEHRALDKLVAMACEKYMACRGSGSGGKSASSKIAKQAALGFVKQTLVRCQTFEDTGKSCFNESLFRDMLLTGSSHLNDTKPLDANADGESGKQLANTSSCSLEIQVPAASVGIQQCPSSNNHDVYSCNAPLPLNQSSEQATGMEDTWSNKMKKKELSLDDVGGTTTPSCIGASLSNSAKGKRTERDGDGKVNGREVSSRNGMAKIGRSTSCTTKGERKSKSKPKQKTTQLSASVNGLLGKLSEQPKDTLSSVRKSGEITKSSSVKEKDGMSLDVLKDPEAMDLSHLQLPGMDILSGPDDLGGQGQDISSWLNLDDNGLEDHDFDGFDGLEIPMDDLSDLNMTF
ncbi:hypothetical protein NMG60_11022011 [Bertholletia excelsa]